MNKKLLFLSCCCISLNLFALVDPQDGENGWQIIKRIGMALDIVEPKLSDVQQTVNDGIATLCSKLEKIEVDVADLDGDVATGFTNTNTNIDYTRIVLCSKFEALDIEIDNDFEVVCSKLDNINCDFDCDLVQVHSVLDDLTVKFCVLESVLDLLHTDTMGYRYTSVEHIVDSVMRTEAHVLTVRNKTMVDGNVNTVNVRISAFGGGSVDTANKAMMIRLKKEATVTGTSFVDIDSSNSVLEMSTAGTYSVGTGKLEFARSAVNNSSGPGIDFVPEKDLRIILRPGESCTVTAVSLHGIAMDILGYLTLEEQF